MQGGTRNCPSRGHGTANKKLFLATCHRRPAGRDPTARRWSPKAKGFKAAAESGVPGFSFIIFMLFMVKLYLSSSVPSVSFPQSRDKTCISPLLLVPFFRFLYDFQTTFWTICPVPSGTDENSLRHHRVHREIPFTMKNMKSMKVIP